MAVTVKDIEGRNSEADVSSSYKEICTRTSWVDARTALAHITKGRASGSRGSLWLRSRLQDQLESVGDVCDRHAGKVIFVAILVLASFCVGLKSATLVTDIEELWVQEGGRLQQELEYVENTLGNGAGSTKQILIQTSKTPGLNILNAPSLLTHLEILKSAIDVTVDLNDTTWSFHDICYAPTFPKFEKFNVEQILEQLNPCTIITPLDCFWEGSLLLGPEYPVRIPGIGSGVRWSNLNPSKLVEKVNQISDQMMQSNNMVSFTSFVNLFKRAGITTGYQEKPCLDPLDGDCPDTAPNKGSEEPLDVAGHLSGGCYGFAGRYMHWPEHLIVGSTARNKTDHIVRGEALQSVVQLMGSRNLFEYYSHVWKVHNIDWTQQKAEAILTAWMNKFTQKVAEETARLTGSNRSYRILSFSDATLSSLIKNFSKLSVPKVAIGYCIMLSYAVAVLCRPWDFANSQIALGVAGVFLMAFGVAAGFGFCALLGLPFSAASTQVLPFLALGLSVNSLFILLQTAKETLADPTESQGITKAAIRRNQVSAVMKRCGVSILMISLCTSVGFACAALIPVPALRYMCLQSAILIIVNLLVVLLVFPALLSLDLRRRNAGRSDVLCCFEAPASNPDIRIGKGVSSLVRATDTTCCLPQPVYSSGNDQSTERKSVENTSSPDIKLDILGQDIASDERPQTEAAPSVDSLGSTRSLVGEGIGISSCIVRSCEKAWIGYIECVTSEKIRCFGILLLLASLAGTVWGVSKLKDGLSLASLVPKGSAEFDFLSTQQQHFSVYHMFTVTKGHFEYPREQKLLHEFHSTFTRVPYILKDDNGGLPDSWLGAFRDWLIGLQKAFDKDWASGCINEEEWFHNATDEGVLAYKLLVQTGHVDYPVDRSLVTQTRLVDEEGIINPRTFYNYLSAWVTNDAMAYSASQADIKPEPRSWVHDRYAYDLKIPKSSPIMYAQMPFFLRHLNDTDSMTDMIVQIRDICDKFQEQGLPNFPTGIPFTFWEQYIHLRFFLVLALLAVVVGVFLIVAIVLLNVWAAALVVLSVSLLVFQLAGLMGVVGIRLSAAPAVFMVAAVGLGMEFTLHIVMGFLTAVGGRRRRVALSLAHMAPPVLHGAMSTLLTALMLLFSEFDFIRRCFFYVIAGLVMIGMVDGLFFLPIILSIIGPSAELISHAHPDRLPTPTPPPSPQPPTHHHHTSGGVMRYNNLSSSHYHTPSTPGLHHSKTPLSHRHGTSGGICRPSKKPVDVGSSYSGAPFNRHYHGGSNLSLSTITEEPSSSHSTQSSREIVIEPEMVVETTTYGNSNNDSVTASGESSGGGHFTTKVTAKVKVELHTPMTNSSVSSSGSNGSRRSSCTSRKYNNNNNSNSNKYNNSSAGVHSSSNNNSSKSSKNSSNNNCNNRRSGRCTHRNTESSVESISSTVSINTDASISSNSTDDVSDSRSSSASSRSSHSRSRSRSRRNSEEDSAEASFSS